MAMLYKSICVLVAGPMGSGKSTFSDFLMSELTHMGWSVVKCSFAQRVKEIATLMGWDGKKDDRGRRLLQYLGTEAGRSYNQDMWSSYLIDERILSLPGYPFDVVIIDDWRFPNEREYVESNLLYDVVTIRIIREGYDCKGHVSETSLPLETDWDYYTTKVYNTGDLFNLQRSAISVADYLKTKYNRSTK